MKRTIPTHREGAGARHGVPARIATAAQRRELRAHYAECDRVAAARDALRDAVVCVGGKVIPCRQPLPSLPPFPAHLQGLTCSARTRAGTPCRMTSIYANGRCKLHGGLSTGPKTQEGRERSLANLRRRWKPMGG